MKRSEAVKAIIEGVDGIYENYHDKSSNKPYQILVDNGFLMVESTPFGRRFIATAATPLAMLTPTQFLCAQQLVESGEIGLDTVPRAQRTHMWKLADAGWADGPCGFTGWKWKPTQKLIEAIECWREAKENKI